MTAASSKRAWTWRCSSPIGRASQARGGSAQARQAARPRHFQHHRARGGRLASRAPKSASTARARSRCSPAASTRARATRPSFKQIVCDRLGVHPNDVALHPGRHRQGVLRRRHRRLALGHASSARPFHDRRGQDHRQGQADRRAHAQGRCRRHQLRRRHLLQPQDQPDADHQGRGARRRWNPANLPQGMEAGPDRDRDLYRPTCRTSRTACHICEVEIDEETGEVEIVALQRGRRRRHGDQSAAAARPDRRRRGAGRRPDADGRHPVRRRRPDHHRLVHGLRHAARATDSARSMSRAIRCRPRPIRSASRARAKPAASARCRRSPMHWSTRSRSSASGTSRCRQRRSGSGAPSMEVSPLCGEICRHEKIVRSRHVAAEVGVLAGSHHRSRRAMIFIAGHTGQSTTPVSRLRPISTPNSGKPSATSRGRSRRRAAHCVIWSR